MQLTQAELAKRLGLRQDTISRADMLLSTLQSHVEAIGGRLALVAELPNRPPVRIKGFSVLADESEELDEPDRARNPSMMRADLNRQSGANEDVSPVTTNLRPSAASAPPRSGPARSRREC
jgi:hypothetical protein